MVNAQAELLMKPAVQALTMGADLPQSWLGADLPVESDPSPPFTLCNLLHLPRSEFWIHPMHHCTAILGFPLCSKPPLLDCCLMIFSGVRLYIQWGLSIGIIYELGVRFWTGRGFWTLFIWKMIYKSRIFMDVPYFAGEFLSLCNLPKQQKHKEQQNP